LEAVAEFPALGREVTKRKTAGPVSRNLAWLVSLCLHLGVLLLLICVVPHRQGAPLPKSGLTIIALQPLPAPQANSAASPQAARTATVNLPIKQRPHSSLVRRPAPAPAWLAAPTPDSSLIAAAAAPPDPAPAAESEQAAAPAGAETSAAAAGDDAGAATPLAYLVEVSRVIRVNLDRTAAPRSQHGVTVVHIRIARDGTVLDAGIIRSSGSPALDQEARDVVLRIHKFPEPPVAFFPQDGAFSIDQPIRFLS
jgi:protein TonB